MSQHDYSIANQGFPATRADINNVLSAIATNNSGTSAPSTQYAGQFWIDTTSTTWTLYIHDGADDIQFATIDTSANTVNFIDSELGDNSVTTSKIADGNVTSAKLSYPLTTFTSTGIDDNATSTAITIDSSENVGIGESSPSSKLHVYSGNSGVTPNVNADDLFIENNGAAGITIGSSTSEKGNIFFADSGNALDGYIQYAHDSRYLRFATATLERMRIDSSGNLLVGKTTTTFGTAGFRVEGSTGVTQITRDGGKCLDINRLTSDGNLAVFYKDGTTVGSIGVNSGRLYIQSDGGANLAGIEFSVSGASMTPRKNNASSDNEVDVGSATFRWDDVYATNGTIQTSDQNEKQSIQSLTTAEMNVAKRLSPLIKTFKWNSAVEEKGDSARTHTGIIAQDVQQAFADEGLDASNYALFISSTWWENSEGDIKEEAMEGYTKKTRLGVRYPELLSFIQAYNDQRFTELEARITALENN